MPISTISQTISTIPEAGRRGVDVQTQFVIKQEDFQDHLQGTTVTELNTLKTQINTTVSGMNAAVTNVNTKASEADADALSASNSANTATTKASEASTSASQASTSASQAETFKNSASTSATTATTKASEASASATTATTKASEASASATSASTKASEASASATSASTSASQALASKNKANQWADANYNVEVEAGKYSAKHWSTVAQSAVIEDTKGANIASATTTTIGTAGLGDYIHITGTTTITSFGTATSAGTRRTLIFDGALTVTHNATSLICTGSTNIITVAGTVIEIIAETITNWRVVSVTHPSLSMEELGYLNGVTSAIQTQINAKAPTVSPAFTGTPTAPTQTAGDNSTNLATTAYVGNSIGQLSTDFYQGPYGMSWDYATDTYIRTGSKGYTAIQSMMRRCVVNANGTVNYYLNPNNSNFKADGTPSVLTGADGNVMVEIPKHYIKVETVGNVDSFSVSLTPETGYVLDPAFLKWNDTAMVEVPYRYFRAYEGFVSGGKLLSVSGVTPTRTQTIATFRTQAMANGAGWHLTDWNLLNTIKRLCYIEFADLIVTKYLGNGNDAGTDYGITTGQSNALGNRSSNSTHNDTYMSYRGIENLYADVWEFVDGVNVNNYQFYVNGKYSTFQSDVFTGDYVAKGPLTVAAASNSLIKRCAVSSDGGFIPTVVGGSTTTFYGDALWSATGARVAIYGCDTSSGRSAGLGALGVYDASSYSYAAVGAAVCR